MVWAVNERSVIGDLVLAGLVYHCLVVCCVVHYGGFQL